METTSILNRNESYTLEKPKLRKKRKMILDILKNFPNGATSQEIEEATKLPINQVSGRLSELSASFYIKASGSKRCQYTGRNRTIWSVNNNDYRIYKQNKAFVELRDRKDLLVRDKNRGVSTLGLELLQKEINKINKQINRLG